MFAEVIFPQQKILKSLTYSVPSDLESKIHIGQAIEVPLRNSTRIAYVVRLKNCLNSEQSFEIKSIFSIKAEGSFFDETTLKLMEWMSSYYILPLYKILPSVLPIGSSSIKKIDKFFKKTEETEQIIINNTTLNSSQKKVYDAIVSAKSSYHLIHGVTGSGKTQIYSHLLKHFLEKGLSSIMLIPEIGLSYQLFSEIQNNIGENVFLLHSGLSAKERRETWTKIFHANVAIVVGTRSAIFAPLKNLGCIIVDEEQDSSYKQEQTPRYNAKAIAFKRALLSNAKLILGSATPSVNTMYQAKKHYQVHNLTSRYNNAQMPVIKVIDMKTNIGKTSSLLSKELQIEIQNTLQKKEQVLILYNHRGVSKFLRCEDCGEVILCPRCSISLTLHQDKQMKCHYCGYHETFIENCKKCGSKKIKKVGKGIQTLEKEIKNIFGYAKIKRVDSDISSDSKYLQETLTEVKEHKIDILVGTQMIAKGHHFPNVTLVAVVNADNSLYIPDIYSNERTFSLLVQVIGRAGRCSKQGRVVIQTFHPEHYAIKNAITQNYFEFYRQELEQRKLFLLPPFFRIIRLYTENFNETKAEEDLLYIVQKIGVLPDTEITEPFPAMIYKLKNRYRWNVLIKYTKKNHELKKKLFDINFDKKINSRVYIDIDPISYM